MLPRHDYVVLGGTADKDVWTTSATLNEVFFLHSLLYSIHSLQKERTHCSFSDNVNLDPGYYQSMCEVSTSIKICHISKYLVIFDVCSRSFCSYFSSEVEKESCIVCLTSIFFEKQDRTSSRTNRTPLRTRSFV